MATDAIIGEAFEQFRFDRTGDRVVHSLVDARPYPSMARGYFRCLRHVPRAGAILGLLISGFRNLFVRFFS
jgi:hypothetical protein